jgi:hypothetical protein
MIKVLLLIPLLLLFSGCFDDKKDKKIVRGADLSGYEQAIKQQPKRQIKAVPLNGGKIIGGGSSSRAPVKRYKKRRW